MHPEAEGGRSGEREAPHRWQMVLLGCQPWVLPPPQAQPLLSLWALQKREPCSPLPGRAPEPRQRLGWGSTTELGVRAAAVIVQVLGTAWAAAGLLPAGDHRAGRWEVLDPTHIGTHMHTHPRMCLLRHIFIQAHVHGPSPTPSIGQSQADLPVHTGVGTHVVTEAFVHEWRPSSSLLSSLKLSLCLKCLLGSQWASVAGRVWLTEGSWEQQRSPDHPPSSAPAPDWYRSVLVCVWNVPSLVTGRVDSRVSRRNGGSCPLNLALNSNLTTSS